MKTNTDHEIMTTPNGGKFHLWHKPIQRELGATDDCFNLAGQTGADPDRIVAEREQREEVKREAAAFEAKHQQELSL